MSRTRQLTFRIASTPKVDSLSKRLMTRLKSLKIFWTKFRRFFSSLSFWTGTYIWWRLIIDHEIGFGWVYTPCFAFIFFLLWCTTVFSCARVWIFFCSGFCSGFWWFLLDDLCLCDMMMIYDCISLLIVKYLSLHSRGHCRFFSPLATEVNYMELYELQDSKMLVLLRFT